MAYKKSLRKKRTNRRKYNKITRKRRNKGGGKDRGSNLRNDLVSFCRRGNVEAYDVLTNSIISETRRGKKNFLFHLYEEMMKKNGFGFNTLVCLKRALMRLQEEAIPDSMPPLEYISNHTRIKVLIDGEWKNGRGEKFNPDGTYYVILDGGIHEQSVDPSIIKWKGKILKRGSMQQPDVQHQMQAEVDSSTASQVSDM